jgi:hypothetical protein
MFKQVNLSDSKETAPIMGEIHLKDINPLYYDKMIQNKELHDTNFAFVSTTLAKLHETAYDPIWYVTWRKDIPVDIGGGFVDYVEYFTINWQGVQNQTENLFGNNAGIIPRVNASANQNIARVYTYEIAYDLKFVELEKLNTLRFQKSIQDIYRQAIAAGFELFAQTIAYTGVSSAGDHGLFNNVNVKIYSIPEGVSTGTKFKDLTNAEIISLFNGIMAEYLTKTNWNLGMLPDTFLLPAEDAQELSNRFSEFFNKSLRNYLLENNFGVDEMKGSDMEASYKFSVRGRPQLDALGTVSNGRIVVYRNEKTYVRMDMPYPLQVFYTGPNVERAAYTSFFVGQISKIQMPYNDGATGEFGPVTYWDFGADLEE